MLKNIFNPSEVGLGEHNLENVPGDSYSVQMVKEVNSYLFVLPKMYFVHSTFAS